MLTIMCGNFETISGMTAKELRKAIEENDSPLELNKEPPAWGKLIEALDEEIQRHKAMENEEATSWGRGFHNGAMTEAVVLKGIVKKVLG